MKIRVLVVIFSFLGIITLATFLYFQPSEGIKTENVVTGQYENQQGLIKNFPKGNGQTFLSESIGQYMTYLLIIGDKKEFKHQVDVLQNHFLVYKGSLVFIKWQLKKTTTTNASIDDLRIIQVLDQAGIQFHQPSYIQLADQLKKTLESVQIKNGALVDFYDWRLNKQSESIHLSYINEEVLKGLTSINLPFYRDLLERANKTTPFFYEIYNVNTKTFEMANPYEVNMIDQLLIAIQYEKIMGYPPKQFDTWIKHELRTQGKFYGRYQRHSLKPAVKFQSSAVYALSLLYFIKAGDSTDAKTVHQLLLKEPPFEKNKNYSNVHFFDFITAKIVEGLYMGNTLIN